MQVPGNESSLAISLWGVKVRGRELARVLLADSLLGAKWPGSKKAVNDPGLNTNPSIVLGGVCRYATAALLMYADFTSIQDGILSTLTLTLKARVVWCKKRREYGSVYGYV